MMNFLFPELIPVVATLTLLIISLTYMGGKFLRQPEWEAYFNIELYNLVIAMLIVGAAYGFFEGAKAVTASMLCTEGSACPDPMDSAQGFLNGIVNRGVLPMYKDLLVIEAGTAMSSNFMIRVGPGVWSFVYKVEPGADAILSMARMMSFGLLIIYGSISMQYMGMGFISAFMPVAMWLGVLLFIFPPTRDAGAFLISFAFAFQTIFPFTYALNQLVLNDMACVRQNLSLGDPSCDPYEMYYMRGVTGMASYLVPFASVGNFLLLIPYINAMAHLSLISLFLPALSISLTIAFINAITKFLMWKI